MLFNSYDFVFLFLPFTLVALYCARRFLALRVAVWTIGAASLVFYAAWSVHLLPVLLVSVAANYLIGMQIISSKGEKLKRCWLTLGVAGNLATIGYFKYTGFILSTVVRLTGHSILIPDIVLPVGISFFTFTQIAFLVDASRGHYPHKYPFPDYLLFVTFFPHLVAGPILIHKFVIPQFESERFGRPSVRTAYAGTVLFCIGLFKKVMIADSLAPYVNLLYASPATLSMPEAWLAALLYTLQLYFDFSGYSDMAFGLALLMNVRIPNNFNSPYKAASMTEFWRRWHISLSRFLRDYLYIPLGGNRKGPTRQTLNLLTTMSRMDLCRLGRPAWFHAKYQSPLAPAAYRNAPSFGVGDHLFVSHAGLGGISRRKSARGRAHSGCNDWAAYWKNHLYVRSNHR